LHFTAFFLSSAGLCPLFDITSFAACVEVHSHQSIPATIAINIDQVNWCKDDGKGRGSLSWCVTRSDYRLSQEQLGDY